MEEDLTLTPHRRSVLERLRNGEGAYNGTPSQSRGAQTRAVNWLSSKGLINGWFEPTEQAKSLLEDGVR